jgi:putative membrane protein
MNVKLILGMILAGMAVIFIVQNVAVVELRFLIWTMSISSALLLFLIFAIGLILGWLLHGYIRNKKTQPVQKKAL